MAGSQPLPEGYLDLYKLAVEMADRVSARRTTANTFFLTVFDGPKFRVSAPPPRDRVALQVLPLAIKDADGQLPLQVEDHLELGSIQIPIAPKEQPPSPSQQEAGARD